MDLSQVSWNQMLAKKMVVEEWATFKEKVLQAMSRYISLKEKSRTNKTRVPWMMREIEVKM